VTLPPGYEERSVGAVTGFAWAQALEWLELVLGQGLDLHSWAASREDAKPLVGRGPVHAIGAPAPGPDGRQRWAVRRYRRGGRVAPVLGDRYLGLGVPRPMRELLATTEARSRGILAPAVVAGAIYPAGPFYRANLVTELIPNARTLEALIFGSGGTPDASDVLRAAGRLVTRLEDAAVLHADLNAANVLLVRGDEGSGARVVDLDRCRVFPVGAAPRGDRMRRRLERSLRKLAGGYGRPFTGAEWDALKTGYTDSG
jgi:3-deoxy-D-manno-octulosonic acid kinase